MKKHRTIRSLGLMAILTILLTTGFVSNPSFHVQPNTAFTNLDLYANIETVGVIVSGKNLPTSAEVIYREVDSPEWKRGHPLMRIEGDRLVGSLFELNESTSYEVIVIAGENNISGFVSTQPNQLQFEPSKILYVDDDAVQGGNGSATAPFQTIQEGVNFASPGTQVLVADGVYHEEVNIPVSGTENNWIQVKAMGQNAILDGSKQLSGNIWERSRYKNVWHTRVVTIFQYLARDGERYYRFDSLDDLVNTRAFGSTVLKEGWYFDPQTLRLYVRSIDDPANHTWQLPMLNQAFRADKQSWIWIEGFEIRYYGTTTSSCGVCINDTSHVVIRKNRIHHIQIGVFTKWLGEDYQGNDTRIEFNEIYDSPVDEWPWKAVKSTSMEGTAILIRGHKGTIVRGNNIHNYFNGIYSSSSGDPHNFELALDVDIYNNYIHHIGDDAFEPEGACVNHRFRINIVEHIFVGLSLAPITNGPTWAMRNIFNSYTGRAIKMDGKTDGVALIYHNTFWSDEKNINAIDLISRANNIVIKNNIFQSNGYSIKQAPSGSTGNHWDNNNLHSTSGILSPAFMWHRVNYYDLKTFCKASGLECNSYTDDPGLVNPEQGLFGLLPNSPNLDRGVILFGINDQFAGDAPDVGALEYDPLREAPVVASITTSTENPTVATNVTFRVIFTEPVIGVGFMPPFHGFQLDTDVNMPSAGITDIIPVSNTIYDVYIKTGDQDGFLRLVLEDDNSIFGQGRRPLGGSGVGDGTYTNGEAYIIDRTPPTVIQILPADPNPTPASIVRFAVTFSEPVSGVDKSDFFVAARGTLNGVGISSVTGAGSDYIVTVNTTAGEGNLHLNVIDDDSIVDIMDRPLGGPGLDNGTFTVGQDYIISKTTLVQNTKIFYSSGKYDGWIRESRSGSSKGGRKNTSDEAIYLGYDANQRQYRAILHFDIFLPDVLSISKVTLLMKKKELVEFDPFTSQSGILVDIKSGVFGEFGPFPIKALQKSDYQFPASMNAIGKIENNPLGEWYWTTLDSATFTYFAQSDTVQLRLAFDPGNASAEHGYLEFYSGDSKNLENRPQLLIDYYERK